MISNGGKHISLNFYFCPCVVVTPFVISENKQQQQIKVALSPWVVPISCLLIGGMHADSNMSATSQLYRLTSVGP